MKNQIMGYCWTFGKDPLNLEKFCEWSTIKYDIIDYGVMLDLQKKPFIETSETCPHWLKVALWKELILLLKKYRIISTALIFKNAL